MILRRGGVGLGGGVRRAHRRAGTEIRRAALLGRSSGSGWSGPTRPVRGTVLRPAVRVQPPVCGRAAGVGRAARRFALGYATNGNSRAERCGLAGEFAFELYAHENGLPKKPEPAFYAAMVDRGRGAGGRMRVRRGFARPRRGRPPTGGPARHLAQPARTPAQPGSTGRRGGHDGRTACGTGRPATTMPDAGRVRIFSGGIAAGAMGCLPRPSTRGSRCGEQALHRR